MEHRNVSLSVESFKLTKPFIQVGIFGVENNAVKTGNQMSKLGLQTNTFEFNEFC